MNNEHIIDLDEMLKILRDLECGGVDSELVIDRRTGSVIVRGINLGIVRIETLFEAFQSPGGRISDS